MNKSVLTSWRQEFDAPNRRRIGTREYASRLLVDSVELEPDAVDICL